MLRVWVNWGLTPPFSAFIKRLQNYPAALGEPKVTAILYLQRMRGQCLITVMDNVHQQFTQWRLITHFVENCGVPVF